MTIRAWPEIVTLRFLIQCQLRKHCEGGPRACPDSEDRETHCESCWKPKIAEHCSTESPMGALLARAIDTEWALSKRIQIRLDDIPADEYLAMKVIDEERRAVEKEEQLLKHA